MLLVSDLTIAQLQAKLDVNAAIRAAYIEAARGVVDAAPVLRVTAEKGAGNFKFASAGSLVGGKLGSYWPGNSQRGLENHAATTILLDPETGYVRAILAARLLNRLRTAAGNAVATNVLARDDCSTLALIGAGGQAVHEARALAAIRPIDTIYIGVREVERGRKLQEELIQAFRRVEVVSIERAVRHADIVVTVTSARQPLVEGDWLRRGTHVSAMGADAIGKQELFASTLGMARLFADSVAQSLIVGEFQHCVDRQAEIVEIGAVLSGDAAGRRTPDEITIFDSSGLAIQDLKVAEMALEQAVSAGLAISCAF